MDWAGPGQNVQPVLDRSDTEQTDGSDGPDGPDGSVGSDGSDGPDGSDGSIGSVGSEEPCRRLAPALADPLSASPVPVVLLRRLLLQPQ